MIVLIFLLKLITTNKQPQRGQSYNWNGLQPTRIISQSLTDEGDHVVVVSLKIINLWNRH